MKGIVKGEQERLYSFMVIVSPSETLMGDKFFTHPEIVDLDKPYSRSNCGDE